MTEVVSAKSTYLLAINYGNNCCLYSSFVTITSNFNAKLAVNPAHQ